MVVIEKEGSVLDTVTVLVGSKTITLNEKADPKILYSVVEELSRVLLNINKNDFDINQSITTIYNKVDKLSSEEAAIALAKLELVVDSLRLRGK